MPPLPVCGRPDKTCSVTTEPAPPPSEDQLEEIVVFPVTGRTVCRRCKTELKTGDFLRSEGKRPFCLACADLNHLVFLPRGDTALTRRARKHSTLCAVVVRFSRRRRRLERQGLLIEEAALERAKRECLADAPVRERARQRAARRRAVLDQRYVQEFAARLGKLVPGCPAAECQAIAERACQKYSGRVGRSAAAQGFDPKAMELAVRAHIRHRHTAYDRLLDRGRKRDKARNAVRKKVNRIFERWRQPSAARSDGPGS